MASLRSIFKRVDNLFREGLKENIFFLHIPKCGGSSIRHAIRMNYLGLDVRKDRQLLGLDPAASANVVRMTEHTDYPHDTNDDFSLLKFRENLLIYYMSQEKTRYIAGHFTFSNIAYEHFADKFAFVTLLRDPVKRWISTYFYNRYKKADHFKVDLEIDEYLESDFGLSQGFQYIKFIGGPSDVRDYVSNEAIERAKTNLHKFAVVGILEDTTDFSKKFIDRFNVHLNIETRNRNPKPDSIQKKIITPEVEEKIRDICRPDYEVYRYAVDAFTSKEGEILR